MWWPGIISSGKICNKLSSTIDLLPTIATITEAKLPEEKIDGVNILPLLMGVENANPREYFYFYYHKNSLEGVRKGAWKLVLPHNYRSYESILPGNDGFPGPYNIGSTDTALFNLVRDPGERYDVKDQFPEVVNELFQLVETAREDLGDDLTGRKGKNMRPVGKLDLIE
jgi:arylsulfatase